jgi:hypothetical protein
LALDAVLPVLSQLAADGNDEMDNSVEADPYAANLNASIQQLKFKKKDIIMEILF